MRLSYTERLSRDCTRRLTKQANRGPALFQQPSFVVGRRRACQRDNGELHSSFLARHAPALDQYLAFALSAAQDIGVVDAVKGTICERQRCTIGSQHAAAITNAVADRARPSDAQARQWYISDDDLAAGQCREKKRRPAGATADLE